MMAGVCAGLAESMHLHPNFVRVTAVLALFVLGLPVAIAYLVAAALLPEGSGRPHTLAVDWQDDGVRVAWSGALAPHAVPWTVWWGGFAGMAGLSVIGGAWLGYAAMGQAYSALLTAAGLALPVIWVAAMLAMAPRGYALTVTHQALWVERPLRGAVRVPLDQVESLHRGRDAITVHTRDGTLWTLPPAPRHDVWDAVQREVRRGRARTEGFAEVMRDAEAARAEVERLLP